MQVMGLDSVSRNNHSFDIGIPTILHDSSKGRNTKGTDSHELVSMSYSHIVRHGSQAT